MANVGIVFSGCSFMNGSEIHGTILTPLRHEALRRTG